jgi:hypothetical protein
MPTTNEVAPFSQQATPPPLLLLPKKVKTPHLKNNQALYQHLKMQLHSRQLLKTVQAPKF